MTTFDVFLSYNSEDKPSVRELKQQLTHAGLKCWLDEDELTPGENWQPLMAAGIAQSGAAVVCIGPGGIGPWEDEEQQALLNRAVSNKLRVIPVLLPGAPLQPELQMFLTTRTWVDLREGYGENGIKRLIWGITGCKPEADVVPEAMQPKGNPTNPSSATFSGKKKQKRQRNSDSTSEKSGPQIRPSPLITAEDVRKVRLRRWMKMKYNADFNDSWLDGPIEIERARKLATDDLTDAGLISGHGDLRIGQHDTPLIGRDLLTEEDRRSLCKRLQSEIPLRINCAALFPAAIGVILDLRDFLEAYDVQLELDHSDINSHNQLTRMKKEGEHYSFLIAADAASFTFSDVSFRRMLVCHGECQWVVARRGFQQDDKFKLFVFRQSTAELQFRLGRGIPNISGVSWIDYGERIPYLKKTLDKGQCLLVWEPLAHIFLRSPNFAKVYEKPVRCWISLYCHHSWMDSKRDSQRNAFYRLFVDQWRRTNLNREAAFARIVAVDGILEQFAISAGIKVLSQYAL